MPPPVRQPFAPTNSLLPAASTPPPDGRLRAAPVTHAPRRSFACPAATTQLKRCAIAPLMGCRGPRFCFGFTRTSCPPPAWSLTLQLVSKDIGRLLCVTSCECPGGTPAKEKQCQCTADKTSVFCQEYIHQPNFNTREVFSRKADTNSSSPPPKHSLCEAGHGQHAPS